MVDRVRTIGTGGDYADPILWSNAEGNINDGNRAVGELIEDVTMSALFRPNQSFPNGGLLRGNITVTGEPGVGRKLGNTAGARIVLGTVNIDFEDIIFDKGANTYSIQNAGNNTLTRVIDTASIIVVSDSAIEFNNCVVAPSLSVNASVTAGSITLNNCYCSGRPIIRERNLLIFKNSISTSLPDWLLGRGTYDGSDTLVNYSFIAQDAPASDFGTGSSDNTYPYDSTNAFVDLSGGDYRTRSDSPLATAGEGGGFVGAFLQSGGGDLTITPVGIASTTNFGSPSIFTSQVINPTGISNTTYYGNPTLLLSPIILPTGIDSTFGSGTPNVVTSQFIEPSSVTSTIAFGLAEIKAGNQYLVPISIDPTTEFGLASIYSAVQYINANGIPSGIKFGRPILEGGDVVIVKSYTIPITTVIFKEITRDIVGN